MIAFLCSGCGKSLKVKDELAGRKGRCPHCQQPMTVPSVADAARERTDRAGADDYSETDAKTVLPPSADAERDPKTVLPAVPRGKTGLKKGNTLVPGVAAAKDANAELYDFLTPAQAADEIGRLGPYRVLKVLGAGGMGVVFQAEDPRLNRLVALKAMLPALAASGSNKERFLREARAAAAIEHDHIVAIFQVDEDRGVPFIAMPFLRGESLEDRLMRERKLPISEALRIGKETADGLAAAHERGMIHRDIKPANIWLEGDKGRVKVLDFGLARSARGDSQLTQQGAIVGTPAYMAPEQGAGKQVDTRCDLFSLGCVLYRMATGTMPFKGADTVSTLVAVATETPKAPRKLNPEVSPRLSKLIMELLAKDPKERPPSGLSVVDLIEELELEPPPDPTAVTDGSARRTRTSQDDEGDTVHRDADEWEDEEQPAKRSLMLPLLIAGGLGVVALMVIAIIGIIVAFNKKDEPQVVKKDAPPIQDPVNKQPPFVDPDQKKFDNPNPIQNTKTDNGEPKNNPGEEDPPVVRPKRRPKKEPRKAGKSFKPYNSAVKGLIFAPGGKHFISFGERKTRVDYWDLDTGKIVQSFELGAPVHFCVLSPDGTRLIAYNSDRLIAWDVDGGQIIAQTTAPSGWQIVGAGFTADKNVRTALGVKLQNAGALHIFDNATNKLLMVNPAAKKPVPIQILHPAEVQRAFFGPDCKQLVSWSHDQMFRSFDLEAKIPLKTFTVSPGEAKSIAISNDFKRVMATFNEPTVHIYDVESGTESKDIKPKDFGNTDVVAFGSESHLGIVGGFPGAIHLLDLDSGAVKKEFKSGAFVTAVALSPDGKTVLSGDMGGKVYVHKMDD